MRLISPSMRWLAGVLLLGCASSPRAVPPTPPTPAPATQREPAITSGESVVSAMHDRYAGKWYRTLTFKQQTTLFSPSGAQTVQTWYEAARVPGSLRIDTDTSGSGVLYSGDSIYVFASGRLTRADTGRNDLLILGFDVYGAPAAQTAALLGHRGFDLARLHETTWQGQPVYVVGALAGDTTSSQFWVTRDNLLFVRLLQRRTTPRGSVLSEVQFNKYVPAGGGWIAEEVVQYIDGQKRLTEQYSNVRVDVPLADGVFEPRQWAVTRHWMR